MNFPFALLPGLLAIWTPVALADRHPPLPPVTHQATIQACADCHMIFPPQMLPKASWERIMNNLDQHFGENAGLDGAVRQEIAAYLAGQAGDTGGRAWGRKFLRGLGPGDAPLRISETPYWRREHTQELPPAAFQKAEVKSPANCPACHLQAKQGIYEDD